jgi:hypothetical protein
LTAEFRVELIEVHNMNSRVRWEAKLTLRMYSDVRVVTLMLAKKGDSASGGCTRSIVVGEFSEGKEFGDQLSCW